MNNYFMILIISLVLMGCKKEKRDIEILLTNDSISLWDIRIYYKTESNGITIYDDFLESISFNTNGLCELYKNMIYKKRKIEILGPKPNYLGLCNKWEIINDSTIKINCRDTFVVRIISRDTIHFYDTLGVKKHELYRVPPPWNIDEESVKRRDREVESGAYLIDNMDGEMFRDYPPANQ